MSAETGTRGWRRNSPLRIRRQRNTTVHLRMFTVYFMPFLLRAAHIAPGMRVLDIATGTALSAEAVLVAAGPSGHVTAADISPAMVAKGARAYWQSVECFNLGRGRTGAFIPR